VCGEVSEEGTSGSKHSGKLRKEPKKKKKKNRKLAKGK
jgi:hypothetical protein